MPFVERSRQFTKRQVDDTKDLGMAIGGIIARHPKKFVIFLIVEGWVHSLVAHHIHEAKDIMTVLNPF